ncbi:MAG: hypothetical protein RLZZ84_368 [Pseudomonadota bacterium]|jgi:uncharacterized membrane protein YsdA (DUF1294 family)
MATGAWPGSPLLVLLGAINAWTWLSFWYDKRQAATGGRRIAERTLLGLALIGGTPAAFFAQQTLRHKTRKQPFRAWLWLITAAQAGLIAASAIA